MPGVYGDQVWQPLMATASGRKWNDDLEYAIIDSCYVIGDSSSWVEEEGAPSAKRYLSNFTILFYNYKIHGILSTCDLVPGMGADDDFTNFIGYLSEGVCVSDAWKNACTLWSCYRTPYAILVRQSCVDDYILPPSDALFSGCLQPDVYPDPNDTLVYYWFDGNVKIISSTAGNERVDRSMDIRKKLDREIVFAGTVLLPRAQGYSPKAGRPLQIRDDVMESSSFSMINDRTAIREENEAAGDTGIGDGIWTVSHDGVRNRMAIGDSYSFFCESRMMSTPVVNGIMGDDRIDAYILDYTRKAGGVPVINDLYTVVVDKHGTKAISRHGNGFSSREESEVLDLSFSSAEGKLNGKPIHKEIVYVERDGCLIPLWMIRVCGYSFFYNANTGEPYVEN